MGNVGKGGILAQRGEYADNIRGMAYEHPLNLKRPAYPFCPFKTNPPTKEEISVSLKGKRNGSAPGPNSIPYLVYKKVPFLLCHLSLILQRDVAQL